MKKRLYPLLLIICLSVLIGAGSLRSGHEWGDDWAWYVLQAKSIWEGTPNEFIKISDFTNYQSTTHLGPLAYPWGYPLILAPFYAIKGLSPLTLKLPGLFFYAGFLACLYFFAKSRFTQTESLLLVSLFAFNPLLLNFLNQILSDIPFLFFSTLTLLLMMQNEKHAVLKQIFIGASVFFTTFMRTTGILLLGCYLVIEFFRLIENHRDRGMVKKILEGSLIICFTFAVLWTVNILAVPSGGASYLSQYESLSFETLQNSTTAYFNVFSQFFGQSEGWKYVYYLALIFLLLGAWVRWRQDAMLILFFAVWMIVHITYPYWQGPRYIFPLLPIFIYFIFQGIKAALSRLPNVDESKKGTIFSLIWIILAFVFLLESSLSAYNNLQNHRKMGGPFDEESAQVYRYLQKQTSEDSVIVFFKPRAMRLMSNRNSIMSTECSRILLGDYLVLSKLVGENQQIPPERIESCQLPLDHVFENRKFIIYRIQN